jgi:hypothetical protein
MIKKLTLEQAKIAQTIGFKPIFVKTNKSPKVFEVESFSGNFVNCLHTDVIIPAEYSMFYIIDEYWIKNEIISIAE